MISRTDLLDTRRKAFHSFLHFLRNSYWEYYNWIMFKLRFLLLLLESLWLKLLKILELIKYNKKLLIILIESVKDVCCQECEFACDESVAWKSGALTVMYGKEAWGMRVQEGWMEWENMRWGTRKIIKDRVDREIVNEGYLTRRVLVLWMVDVINWDRTWEYWKCMYCKIADAKGCRGKVHRQTALERICHCCGWLYECIQ